MTAWALAGWLAIAQAAPPVAPPPPPAEAAANGAAALGEPKEPKEPKKDNPQWQAARKQLTTILAMLTALSALLMLLGYAVFVRRWGQRVAKRTERLPVKYFDLTVPPEPDPPHEPSAEERRRPRPPD